MKFILDIDGVMVHANPHRRVELDDDGFYKFSSIAVQALNTVINLKEGDELILSTSHRFRFSINQWRDIFRSRGILIDHISVIDSPLNYKHTRKTEIITWIKEHRIRSEEIIIIDDDKSLNELPKGLKERLVLTNPYTGLLGPTELEKLVKRKNLKVITVRKSR